MKFYTSAVESGNEILLRGYENGRAFSRKVKYQPTLYISGKANSEWKSIHDKRLEPIQFDSMREAKEFIRTYEEVDNFEIHGMTRFVYPFLFEEYNGKIEFDRDLIDVANIDIEVASDDGFPDPELAVKEITAITLKRRGTFFVFGCGDYTSTRANVKYFKCRNEQELLLKFLDVWTAGGYPDAVTGWYIAFFDIPYLINRMKNILPEAQAKRLSPWKYFNSRDVRIKGKSMTSMSISGVPTLDYQELYRKLTFTERENYKLDTIANIELKERKIDYSEYATLHQLYKLDYTKFINYNIRDVDLVERLDDKLQLIELIMLQAYYAKVNYTDIYSQTRTWDVLAHNYLAQRKIAIPPDTGKGRKDEAFVGAYVKEPVPGKYKWVVSFDLNSLYPHLIMQFNISPETLGPQQPAKFTIEQLLDKDFKPPVRENWCLAPNGYYFDKIKQGFIPAIMEEMYVTRSDAKKEMLRLKKLKQEEEDQYEIAKLEKQISRYNNRQTAMKIQLNSGYGAFGSQYFRYFDVRQATAITMGGQFVIRWAIQEINEYMNKLLKTKNVDYVIASDTDSLYINMDPIVQSMPPFKNKNATVDFIDKAVKQRFEPLIDKFYQELADKMNAYSNKMVMKREAIAETGFWTGKKRYALDVLDNEGVRYKEPELKITGLEAIKSSTPYACREALKEATRIIIRGTQEELQAHIAKFKSEFFTLPLEDIAKPMSVQGLRDYTLDGKSVPFHVRGALSYNKLLQDKKASNKYEKINEGEKIKFCYLKVPNPSQQNVIAVVSVLPKEFGLDKYIDYDTQFEKTFLQPLRAMLEVVEWTDKKVNTLEDFFV